MTIMLEGGVVDGLMILCSILWVLARVYPLFLSFFLFFFVCVCVCVITYRQIGGQKVDDDIERLID